MKHDCRIGYLETSEDDQGYFYIEWKKHFGTNTGKFKVEYCPVCGTKAKKSSVEHLTMFDRDHVAEDQLQHMHNIIMESFLTSCDTLVKEDLDDKSFKFCMDTIHNTLAYVGAKRKEDNA
jgi:hypothetical protein